jgi:hypothetical protein
MPRCHIRCNIITEPEKGGRRRLRPMDIKPYLPAMFNVRVKDVYEILGMSHHTLAPLRRELGLSSWPFSEVCRGEFRMGGVLTTWSDIERLRQAMMAGADERIVKILQTVGERALKCKDLVNKVVLAKQEQDSNRMATAFKAAGVLTVSAPPPPREGEKRTGPAKTAHEEFPDNAETERIANQVFPDGSGYNWEGLSELLLRRLEAPSGTIFPESDDDQW